jgi:hypothetical protein
VLVPIAPPPLTTKRSRSEQTEWTYLISLVRSFLIRVGGVVVIIIRFIRVFIIDIRTGSFRISNLGRRESAKQWNFLLTDDNGGKLTVPNFDWRWYWEDVEAMRGGSGGVSPWKTETHNSIMR